MRSGQQVVEDPGVSLGQGVEFVGEGEDEVEVIHREQLLAAGRQPSLLCESLAFRTMTVAAGVVDDPHAPTRVALQSVAAEGGCAAPLDGAHGAKLTSGKPMGLPVARPVTAMSASSTRPPPSTQAGQRDISYPCGLGRSKGERVEATRARLRWK